MIARVTLDLALRKELDYSIPRELEDTILVGSRVRVPIGNREATGTVTELRAHSDYPNLKSVLKVIGPSGLLSPLLLRLARWMAQYYCCGLELVLKSMLPDAVRKEDAGWRERLHVTALPVSGALPKLSDRQMEVWQVVEEWRELPLKELISLARTTADTVRRLEDKGLLRIAPRIDERDPYAREQILPTSPLTLTQPQETALAQIVAALGASSEKNNAVGKEADGRSGASVTFLLHGVTGSGKTEIYLQAIQSALQQGRDAIVLVPEISLTPQTVERFKARFSFTDPPTQVAVLHSHLSAGERHDEWHKIHQGRARIVIGARSAVFAPVKSLGLIIVDEEHEHSYKQEETPRYQARDVAVMRGYMEGAVVVLGSATPSVESYYNALHGKYRLVELPFRVTDQKMPVVRVVDLRYEGRGGRTSGSSVFSQELLEAIRQRLERSEQTILFLNRRGYASSMQCPACGHVVGCPNCSISLTYHRSIDRLLCHICGHAEQVPVHCPESACNSPKIRGAGIGTERIEEMARKLFPKAVIARMDRDTLKKKEDYRRTLTDFRLGKTDILIGTQMIAKGLHFPNVTLVGVLNADLSLHIPDFRSGERTFQLLTQVSGRAGRGDVEGEVFVQSFTPFHPAIQFARRHDYLGFYEAEMEMRGQLLYPPLTRIALLTVCGQDEEKVRLSIRHLKKQLDEALGQEQGLQILGPAASPLERAEGFYRHQVMIRTPNMSRTSTVLGGILEKCQLPEGTRWILDIDPANLN